MLTSNPATRARLARESFEMTGDGQPPAAASGAEFLRALSVLGERSRKRHVVRTIAFFGDLLMIAIAILAMGAVRFGDPFASIVLNLLGFVLPVYAVVALNRHCYDAEAIGSSSVGA